MADQPTRDPASTPDSKATKAAGRTKNFPIGHYLDDVTEGTAVTRPDGSVVTTNGVGFVLDQPGTFVFGDDREVVVEAAK